MRSAAAEPQVRDHGDIDRLGPARARSDRAGPRSASCPGAARSPHLLPRLSSTSALAGIAHLAQMRPDIERMPRRERPRPIAQRAVPGRRPECRAARRVRRPPCSAWHQVISSPIADQRVLRLDQQPRAAFATDSGRAGCASARRTSTGPRSPAVACPRSTFVGSDRNTGPHGGVDANFMPRRTVAGIDAVGHAPARTTW